MVNYDFLSVYFYSVPNLRFPIFHFDWNENYFGNICTIRSGIGFKADEYVEQGVPLLKIDNVGYGNIKWNNISYLPETYLKQYPFLKLNENDIVLALNRPITNNQLKISKLTSKDIPSILYQRVGKINVSSDYNLDYIYYLLTKNVFDFVLKTSIGSDQPFISTENLKKLIMKVPTITEQQKIGHFLSLIDQRIQTQIKIIDDCISYRNAIVDYYFESLSGNWKKVKLSNILKEYSELHIKDDSIVHATLSKEGIFPKTDRYDRDFLVKDEDKKYKVTHLNDICYNPANLKFGVITRNTFGDCIISPIYITFKIKSGFIPKFVELLVTRKQFISKARKYEQGTVYERMSVNSSDLLSMYVLIPSFSIQQKIVNIINNIDSKIFNEQKLLNLYKLQKVYLLKNMFI